VWFVPKYFPTIKQEGFTMVNINDDTEFKSYIDSLSLQRQRLLGIKFVEHTLDLVKDQRVTTALETAKKIEVDEELLPDALHGVRKLVFSTYTQCGREMDMMNVAEHYVALATAICLQPQDLFVEAENPACKAALHCRQARSFQLLAQGKDTGNNGEARAQYRVVESFEK
jgi:hypothetical protein